MSHFKNSVEIRTLKKSLIVAFNKANPPLIWKLDLKNDHSFTIAMQGEEGDWEIGMTSPKGEFLPIAHFVMRDDAEEAFVKIRKTLMGKKCGILGKTVFVIILAVIGLACVGHYYKPHSFQKAMMQSVVTPQPSAPAQAPVEPIKEGVPVSADEVLKPPAP